MSGRVTISTGPGASSPTKSMSSGSMSGVVQEREIGGSYFDYDLLQLLKLPPF